MIYEDLKLNLKFDDSYFKEEVKEGFLITKQRKELWSILLDLLNELQRVASKNKLKIIADGGTLLGAVRHSGFIPWDDDIDVFMLRDDYDKLRKLGNKEFKKEYFLQSAYSDKIVRPHMQLRKLDTTMLIPSDYKTGYNKGVFIDIFALDYVPNDIKEAVNLKNKLYKQYKNMIKPKFKIIIKKDSFKRKLLKFGWNLLLFLPKSIAYKLFGCKNKEIVKCYEKWDRQCSSLNNKTHTLGNLQFTSASKRKLFMVDEHYYKFLEKKKFENIMIFCPKSYNFLLTKMYGDYKTPIISRSLHGPVYIDLKNSYKKYDKLTLRQYSKLFG